MLVYQRVVSAISTWHLSKVQKKHMVYHISVIALKGTKALSKVSWRVLNIAKPEKRTWQLMPIRINDMIDMYSTKWSLYKWWLIWLLENVWSSVGWLPSDVSSREFFRSWKNLRLNPILKDLRKSSRPGLVSWKGILMIPLSGIELWRRPVLLMHLSLLKFWEPQKSIVPTVVRAKNHIKAAIFGVFLPLICWSLDPQAWSSCGGLKQVKYEPSPLAVPSKGWQWI